MDEFGTLEDWEEMVDGMHKRHKADYGPCSQPSSDDILVSEALKENPYRDYYIWRKGRGKNGKDLPTTGLQGLAVRHGSTTRTAGILAPLHQKTARLELG